MGRRYCSIFTTDHGAGGGAKSFSFIQGPSRNRVDTLPSRGIHSFLSILQVRAVGKAVRFGHGPATVIGSNAVSQDTGPYRGSRHSSRERGPLGAPCVLVGLFYL